MHNVNASAFPINRVYNDRTEEACHIERREPQACVIRIDNSFSPFLPPFHSNNPLHTIERASKSLQGRSNWTGIFFFFPLHFFLHLTKISSAKCRAEHSSWGNCLRLASFAALSLVLLLFSLAWLIWGEEGRGCGWWVYGCQTTALSRHFSLWL